VARWPLLRPGLRLGPRWGSLHHSSRPLTGFEGALCGREGKGKSEKEWTVWKQNISVCLIIVTSASMFSSVTNTSICSDNVNLKTQQSLHCYVRYTLLGCIECISADYSYRCSRCLSLRLPVCLSAVTRLKSAAARAVYCTRRVP